MIAEEAVDGGAYPGGRKRISVDPLEDKRIRKGGNDFTVNIGLIRNRVPVLGIVYAPATGSLYLGIAGEGAWKIALTDGRPGERARRFTSAPQRPALSWSLPAGRTGPLKPMHSSVNSKLNVWSRQAPR